MGAGWLCLMTANLAYGQESKSLELPECDIFLFKLSEVDGKLLLSEGKNVTHRPGYDNQPWFTPDSQSFLYSANGQPDRTDIFEYFIESGEIKQVTDTPTQEYSPQVSPDNKTVSFVTDGESANQSVWTFDRETGKEHWLLGHQAEREPVGYYSWNHKTGDILFWSRYGFNTRLVHESNDGSHYVSGDAVPSSPYIIPGTNKFSFMHRQGNGETWIKELDPETRAIRPLTPTIGSNPNYGWLPAGHLLMIDGSKLYRQRLERGSTWELQVDLSDLGIESGTRLCVSPNGKWIAIVGN